MDTIPNGHHPEWDHPEYTPSRMDTISNGHHPEWVRFRMDTIPNGHDPEWSHPEWTLTSISVCYGHCLVRIHLQKR